MKISLYICVHIRIISWKCYILNFFSTFHISSNNNFHICLTFFPLSYCRFSFAVSFCQTYFSTILSSTDLLKIWFHSFISLMCFWNLIQCILSIIQSLLYQVSKFEFFLLHFFLLLLFFFFKIRVVFLRRPANRKLSN